MKIRVVTATEAKNRFGDLIKSAYMGDEHVIVKRDGVPVVAIMPINDYEQFMNQADLPDDLRVEMVASSKGLASAKRMAQFLDSVHTKMPDITEEEAEKDIAEAIQTIRTKRAKKTGRASA